MFDTKFSYILFLMTKYRGYTKIKTILQLAISIMFLNIRVYLRSSVD
jgi:hypothetical protein